MASTPHTDVEDGEHEIVLPCTLGKAYVSSGTDQNDVGTSPQTVSISVRGYQEAVSSSSPRFAM